MKNKKVSILDELEAQFNNKDGEETKFSFSSLRATAQTKLTADLKLTEEAIVEANEHSFDLTEYKNLLFVTIHRYHRTAVIFPQIAA